MNSISLIIKRYVFLALAAICMIVIFGNSAEPATVSSQKSGGAADVVTPIVVPGYETHPDPVKVKEKQVVERKLRNVAHAGEFAALGVCAVGVAMTFELNKKKLLNMTFRGLAAFVFCVVYAVLDEVHQIFVEGRTFELKDIMNDSLGAIVGVVLFTLAVWVLDALIRKIKNKNAN